MQPVANTPEILYYNATGYFADEAWVQWAIDMLEAGYDTEHLRILAGETPPYSHWHLQPLTAKVFKELGIDTSDIAGITHNYICYIISGALSGKKSYGSVLDILHELSYEEEGLHDFYMLYYAMQDLKHDTVQWYWHGATRENIADIIRIKFEEWLQQHCYIHIA